MCIRDSFLYIASRSLVGVKAFRGWTAGAAIAVELEFELLANCAFAFAPGSTTEKANRQIKPSEKDVIRFEANEKLVNDWVLELFMF